MNRPIFPSFGASAPLETRSGGPGQSSGEEESYISEWLGALWSGKLLFLIVFAVVLVIGSFLSWRSAPQFQADAMLQLQEKKLGASDSSIAKMEGLFTGPAEAQAEVEVLNSNLVLGRTAQNLKLDVVAEPVLFPIVGAAWMRGKTALPRIELERMDVPEMLKGQIITLTVLPEGGFHLNAPDGSYLGSGRTGQEQTYPCPGGTLLLNVRSLAASPGRRFVLVKRPMPDVLDDMRKSLEVIERGKMTNVLGLAYKASDPIRAAEILNEIIRQYVRQRIERKSTDVAKSRAILEGKMPILKAKLDESETQLNQFRSRSRSVDLSREADISLQQSAALENQISALRQRKQELLRTYRESADVVVTVNQQIDKLQGEVDRINGRMRSLPRTQQEVVRLSRDVQVNTALYTALLNNLQELQIAGEGGTGDVSVVDYASPNFKPVGPTKLKSMLLMAFLGVLAGIGAVVIRREWFLGIEDHRLIESRLGLPVLITVPHSKAQKVHDRAVRRGLVGMHLLAAQQPSDLATESLRSLRTLIHVSGQEDGGQVILFTGVAPGVGKSFISSNFAVVLARAGARVLLVDGDLRRGALHCQFGMSNVSCGLADVLTGKQSWESVVLQTNMPRVDLVGAGSIVTNASDLLMSHHLDSFIAGASKAYDFVILDAPPLLAVSDAAILALKAHMVLLVARYGRHTLGEMRACQRRIHDHGIVLGGCIFNDIAITRLGSYHYYRYAHGYE